MKRLQGTAVICFLLIVILTACGDSSTADRDAGNEQEGATATKDQVTDGSERDATDADAAKERVANEVYPTSTLYAEDQPSPTPLAGAICSYGNPNVLVFQSFEEKRAEFQTCVEEFSWPEGYEINPEQTAFDGDTAIGGQVGVARVTIVFNNACAWTNYWLDATKAGDAEGAEKALQYMLHVLPFLFTPGPPDPANAEPYFLNMAQKAELGDSGPIVQFIKSDCGPYDKYRVRP